ncbi:hypothetical protein HDV01_000673 [Terramyces sp. JEL0728]|nr:hypothetical protein HDV01_000673 [Terramyces sp. JEL0728]
MWKQLLLASWVLAFGSNCPLLENQAFEKFNIPQVEKYTKAKQQKETRIAILGDQGLGVKPEQVLKMVRGWGPDLLLHLGDFDYEDDPTSFMNQFTDAMGKKFPMMSVIGNHDILKWFEPRTGYRDLLLKQTKKSGLDKHCTGEIGVSRVCHYKDMVFVLSGVGTMGSHHEEFIDAALKRYSYVPWKICMWHKNQNKLQTGDKVDETGYAVYDICRKHGAIIFTGHEHSYERTHLLSDFATQEIASTDDTLEVKPGQSFAAVSGLGGDSIRPWKQGNEKNPWWAATAALDNGVNYGALLCTFKHKGSPLKADCKFKDVDGTKWDTFKITTPSLNLAQYVKDTIPAKKFYETTVQSHLDIYTLNSQRTVSSKSVLELREGIQHYLNFKIDIPPKSEIQSAYLQLKLETNQPTNARIEIFTTPSLLSLNNANTLQRQVVTSEGLVENGEVWVSPDVSHLIKVSKHTNSVILGAAGTVLDNTSTVGFYGIHDILKTCMAPTLVIVLK